MSEIKKKTYTKKPSKKERLAAELAQKQAKQQEEARLKSGGTFVRADGVAVSSTALAARQKALQAALAESSEVQSKSDGAASQSRSSNRARTSKSGKTDASASILKIAAASESGKRLAQCLWCAQVLLLDVLQFESAADKQVSSFLREHKELGARDRHIVAETIYAILRHRRVFHIWRSQVRGRLVADSYCSARTKSWIWRACKVRLPRRNSSGCARW